jgi:TRAP-type C4-dicarboxylate transport system permease small subunit
MSPPRNDWQRRADAVLGFAASAVLFSMMLLTFADVVGRYLLSRPVRGAFEVTELMLLTLIFAGLPLVTRADEHVTMDLIDRLLGAHGRAMLGRVVQLLCAALMFLLTWLMWQKAGAIAGYGDTTEVLKIVVGPFVYFMTAMIALSAFIHLYKASVPGKAESPEGI